MFWGLILRGPPIAHVKGVFVDPPRPVEIVRSFHVSKAILFNPRDYYADGANGFVRVMINSPRASIEICRMYNNRSGLTQAELNLTFSRRDAIAFFTSIHGATEQDNPYGPNYVPEIHLSGFYLDVQTTEDSLYASSSSGSQAITHTQPGVKFGVAERVLQHQADGFTLKTVPVRTTNPTVATPENRLQPDRSRIDLKAQHADRRKAPSPEKSKPTPEPSVKGKPVAEQNANSENTSQQPEKSNSTPEQPATSSE